MWSCVKYNVLNNYWNHHKIKKLGNGLKSKLFTPVTDYFFKDNFKYQML